MSSFLSAVPQVIVPSRETVGLATAARLKIQDQLTHPEDASKKQLFQAVKSLHHYLSHLGRPITQKVESKVEELFEDPEAGIFTRQSQFLSDRVIALIEVATSARLKLFEMALLFDKLYATAIDVAIAEISTEAEYLIEEYDQLRSEIHRITPSGHGLPPEVNGTRNDMVRGSGSGIRQTLKLIELTPTLFIEHGLYPIKQDLRENAGTGRFFSSLARQAGSIMFAIERIGGGCENTCFDQNDNVVKNRSPHRGLLNKYGGDCEAFRTAHWKATWLSPERFSIYGEASSQPVIGFDEPLSITIDPLYQRTIGQMAAIERREGCPLLSFNGITVHSSRIALACMQPFVWDALMEDAHPRKSVDRPVRPHKEFTRMFSFPYGTVPMTELF